MGSHYRQYTALVAAVTLTDHLRNKWSVISLTHTPEMQTKFLIWKIGLRMRRWPEVRNLASQEFRLTPDPYPVPVWKQFLDIRMIVIISDVPAGRGGQKVEFGPRMFFADAESKSFLWRRSGGGDSFFK